MKPGCQRNGCIGKSTSSHKFTPSLCDMGPVASFPLVSVPLRQAQSCALSSVLADAVPCRASLLLAPPVLPVGVNPV